MDNVTHALAGGLLAAATVAIVERRAPASPGFRRTAALVGVIAAELPDSDLLYAGAALGMGKLGYLLHHRGHTHTVVFALVAGLLVWAIARAATRAAPAHETRWPLLGLALAGTLSHLALDYTNSYGVHPFWPVENRWHYGDAVFILEPWLWVVALPTLLLLARTRTMRALLGTLLVGVLIAAWTIGMVERGVALALTIGALAWSALLVVTPATRRVIAAGAAWLVVEGIFFTASGAARARVRTAVGPGTLRDAVLTPAVGNPLCFRALVVEVDGPTYRATGATVAPYPALRTADRCGGADAELPTAVPTPTHASSPTVRWGAEWSAPRAELVTLARTHCEVAAALRFIRVPIWNRLPDGGIALSDLRYGGGRGFADLELAARPARCPTRVPGWVPPRQDVLGAG
jgi:inner membrane protein